MKNPFDELQERLDEMRARAENPDEFLDALGQVMLAETRKSFSERESPTGQSWPSLSIATQKIGKRSTGALRNSFSISRQGETLSISSPLAYAMAQNFGNPNNKLFGGKIAPLPARPFSPVDENEEISAPIRGFIEQVFEYILEGQDE